MKSWADHCSSDEESDDEIRNTHPAASSPGKLHPSLSADDDESSVEEEYPPDNDVSPPVPQRRHYDDLPTHPPFTAYIKNLNFAIREDDQLVYELQGLLERRYGGTDVKVQIMSAKLGVDKGGSGRKGFGYVQFATLEELVAFLDCDDGNSEILGRKLHIKVAKSDNRREKRQSHTGPPSRRNENSEIDGSKFRGGRYAQRNNSGKGRDIANHAGPGGDGNHESLSSSQQPTRQRRSLVLAPRTKPLQDRQISEGSSSSIFGNAIPRDEHRLSSARRSVNFDDENNEASSKDVVGAGDHGKGEDASSTASSKDVGMGEEKDAVEVAEGRRPSSSSIGNKGSNGHDERHDRNHHGGRGRGKGRGGGNPHDRNSSSSLRNSGRGGGGRGRGGRGSKWDGPRRDSSGRGGGRGGDGHDRKNNTGRGGLSNGDARKKGSAANADAPKTLQPQPVVKESKPKTQVTNAFAALGFDSDSD